MSRLCPLSLTSWLKLEIARFISVRSSQTEKQRLQYVLSLQAIRRTPVALRPSRQQTVAGLEPRTSSTCVPKTGVLTELPPTSIFNPYQTHSAILYLCTDWQFMVFSISQQHCQIKQSYMDHQSLAAFPISESTLALSMYVKPIHLQRMVFQSMVEPYSIQHRPRLCSLASCRTLNLSWIIPSNLQSQLQAKHDDEGEFMLFVTSASFWGHGGVTTLMIIWGQLLLECA